VTPDEELIRAALDAAGGAGLRDVPVGAVIVAADGTELARAANMREELGDPTAHAEILAMRAAASVLGDGWRLEGTTLAVTVEPCTMCAGALVMARVARLVFGAWEPKTGAVGSLWDVVRDRRLTSTAIFEDEVVVIAAAACELHPNAILKALETQSVKDRLKQATAEAYERGVRGVPTIAVGDELFYGDDRLEEAASALRGA